MFVFNHTVQYGGIGTLHLSHLVIQAPATYSSVDKGH